MSSGGGSGSSSGGSGGLSGQGGLDSGSNSSDLLETIPNLNMAESIINSGQSFIHY
jgi:hypothetical protein